MDTKASLRIGARQILAALTPETRAAASAQICRRIEAPPEWAAAQTVALYAAQSSEPDLSPLLAAPGKIVCLPRVSGDTLEFHHCPSKDRLRTGPWKLLEPDPDDSPLVHPSDIKLFYIPGLAFSRTGARLGRGGGFYDRFLTRIHPEAVKIGVCFHAQIAAALPLEVHDHEVDWVITEAEVIRCK